MFRFFKKTIKLQFVKEVDLTTKGEKVHYYSRKNEGFVTNSLSSNKEEAEKFFNELVKKQGVNKITEVLKEERV